MLQFLLQMSHLRIHEQLATLDIAVIFYCSLLMNGAASSELKSFVGEVPTDFEFNSSLHARNVLQEHTDFEQFAHS